MARRARGIGCAYRNRLRSCCYARHRPDGKIPSTSHALHTNDSTGRTDYGRLGSEAPVG